MSSLKWLTAATVIALVVVTSRANAVPAYARQTGFACNQCHMSWSPTPDFTVTGQKFRMNAYRDPFTADKMEAGQEGAINGKRLVLGLQSYWTWHYRSSLLQQSRATYDPTAGPAPAASSIAAQPFSSVGLDYAGPIGEHFGIWTEYYIDAAGGVGNVRGDLTNAEYTVSFATNPGGPGNIIGIVWTNQELPNDMGFSPYRSGASLNWLGSLAAGRVQPQSRIMTYGFLADRFLYGVGVLTGQDNSDYAQFDYAGYFGYALGNTDDKQLWLLAFWMAGNDATPLMTSNKFTYANVAATGVPTFVPVEAVTGSAKYSNGGGVAGKVYTHVDMGDFYKFEPEIRFGFVDRGPHSLSGTTSLGFQHDKYSDGAVVDQRSWGFTTRYMYDRTLGFTFGINKITKYDFTDRFGVLHTVPYSGIGWSVSPYYRVAMNAAIEFAVNNTHASVLDSDYASGWSWNLSWHFLY